MEAAPSHKIMPKASLPAAKCRHAAGNRICKRRPHQKTVEIMPNEENKSQNEENKDVEEAVEKALKNGRNANDNFQEGKVDDFGADTDEEVQERDEIKGGAGQHGKERNRNDDFIDSENS